MSSDSVVTSTLGVLGLRLPMTDESPAVSDDRVSSADRELLRRISRGETDRYADLVRRYQGHVVRIVSRRVPSDEVEEVVQDVFVRAYLGLSQFSEAVAFDHWLAGIAVRTCYDFWRARKHDALPVSALTDEHHRWIENVLAAQSDEQFRDQARRREAVEVLEWALRQLSAEDRAVLTLVHLEGHTVREAAKLLGWSVINVKVRAHRARQALRKLLNDRTGRL